MDPVRLLIVAGDPLARAGLATLLSGRETLAVVGQTAAAGEEWLEELDIYRPDVVLWDLGWDADELPDDFGEVGYPVLALLPHADLAAESWAAGAQGLLLRSAGVGRLELAARAILQGMVVWDEGLADALRPAERVHEVEPAEPLTAREQEVLQLLAEGLTNRAIAQALAISEHTVKFHVNAIMGKLDAQSRTEAVVRATRLGLILL